MTRKYRLTKSHYDIYIGILLTKDKGFFFPNIFYKIFQNTLRGICFLKITIIFITKFHVYIILMFYINIQLKELRNYKYLKT